MCHPEEKATFEGTRSPDQLGRGCIRHITHGHISCLSVRLCHPHTLTLHFLTDLGRSVPLTACCGSRAHGIILLLSHIRSDRYRPGIFPEFPWAFDRGGFSSQGPQGASSPAHLSESHKMKPRFSGGTCSVSHSPTSLPRHCHLQLPAQAPCGHQMPAKLPSKATLSIPAGTWGTVPTTSQTLPSWLLTNFT